MCTFILYYVLPKKYRSITLLIASLLFYAYCGIKVFFILLLIILIGYVAGLLIDKNSNLRKKYIFIISLVIIICTLIFFKYFNFIYSTINDIIKIFNPTHKQDGVFKILLPLGLSFYIFQTISYLVDLYKGKCKCEYNIIYYSLYISYFPKLISGPIERPDLLKQLKNNNHNFSDVDFTTSFRLMLVGFFKKVVIADVIAIYVNSVYMNLGNSTGLAILIATLLYGIQIFCDFSGYSDIARGVSLLFNINLIENFKNPYNSTSVKEFWGRWHISLSTWFRDYIYFPLGGSRVSKFRWACNILVVFLVSGIWHGASYNFLIWGLLHGVFQIFGVLTLKYRDNLYSEIGLDPKGKIVHIIRVILTFILVDFAWIFFRTQTFGDAVLVISKIFTNLGFSLVYLNDTFKHLDLNVVTGIVLILSIVLLPIISSFKNINKYSIIMNTAVKYSLYVTAMWFIIGSWIYLQATDVGSSFIYFQF